MDANPILAETVRGNWVENRHRGAFAIVVSGLVHLQAQRHLVLLQVALPLYWALHSIATLYAVVELITKPIHWAKTEHGLTRVTRTGQPRGKEVLRPRTG